LARPALPGGLERTARATLINSPAEW
jgi:hypothetical protein